MTLRVVLWGTDVYVNIAQLHQNADYVVLVTLRVSDARGCRRPATIAHCPNDWLLTSHAIFHVDIRPLREHADDITVAGHYGRN